MNQVQFVITGSFAALEPRVYPGVSIKTMLGNINFIDGTVAEISVLKRFGKIKSLCEDYSTHKPFHKIFGN